MSRQLTKRFFVEEVLVQVFGHDEEGTETEPEIEEDVLEVEDNTDFDADFEETDGGQQMEKERHLNNRHLSRHSSPRVDTCSGLHLPRTEEVEREWKTS